MLRRGPITRETWQRIGPGLVACAAASFYVVITVVYVFRIPIGGGPDELEHVDYVDVIARHRRLPTLPGSPASGEAHLQAEQAQHPPLYYLLLAAPRAIALGALSQDASVRALRLLSLLMGLGAFAVIWVAARTLWPGAPWRAAFAVSFFALLPETQYMTSVVNNSNGAMLLTALAVLGCARLVSREESGWKDWLWIGLATGAALCTKMTSTWAVALVVLCAISKTRAETASPGRKLANWAALVLPVVVVLGPWLIRNQWLYGTPMPERITSRRLGAGNLFALIFLPEYTYTVAAGVIPEMLLGALCPYWLLRLHYPRALAAPLIPLLYALPTVGGLICLGRRLRGRKAKPWGPREVCFIGLVVGLVLQAWIVVYMAARDFVVLTFSGRYAWESIGAITLLWTQALFAFPWPRVRAAVVAVTLVAALGFSIWVSQYVFGLQAPAPGLR